MPTLDRATLRVTGRQRTLTAIASGLPVVQLTTNGAKTGTPHPICVLGFPTTQGLVVAAGNFGRPAEPAWCANLRTHPRAVLTEGNLARVVVARELTAKARAAAWQQCLATYPAGAAYARRAHPRVIALFLLEPELDA
jgi:deazaflavin-dependent oxidoreductase (nitroreductase family)